MVTCTLTPPAAWLGVVAVMVVELTTTTDVADEPPSVTVAPAAKPVPRIVTACPPAVGPVAGEIAVTAGPVLAMQLALPLTTEAR